MRLEGLAGSPVVVDGAGVVADRYAVDNDRTSRPSPKSMRCRLARRITCWTGESGTA